jgi:hemoglobin
VGKPEHQFFIRGVDLRKKMGGQWYVVYDHSTLDKGRSMQSGSLYSRLGGYDALAAVVDDFIQRLAGDPKMARFLGGLSANSAAKLRQHLVEQLCMATGGPCVYIGRDMKTAHKGLGITEDIWNAGAGHLVAALDKFHVPEREKNEVVAIVVSLKADIVEK